LGHVPPAPPGPFALLWAGATISTTGDAMSWVALVWLVYRQRGQAGDVAVLAAAYTAPVAVGGLLAGSLLDRFDRRRLLAADNLVRGLAFLTVPAAAALGPLTLTHLYLVAACYGLLKMVSLAGFPTLIPAYVDDADLQRANALEGLSFGTSQAAGAALAAVLRPLVGAAPLLALDALSYLAYAACLARLPAGRPAALAAGGGGVRLADPAAAQHHGHVHAVQHRRGRPAGVPARLQRAARHRGGRLRAAGERRHRGRAGRLDRRRGGRRRPPGAPHRRPPSWPRRPCWPGCCCARRWSRPWCCWPRSGR
jgi:MFS family permease